MSHAFDTAVKDALAFELKTIERRLTMLEVAVDVMKVEPLILRNAARSDVSDLFSTRKQGLNSLLSALPALTRLAMRLKAVLLAVALLLSVPAAFSQNQTTDKTLVAIRPQMAMQGLDPMNPTGVPDDLRDAKIVLGQDRFSKELVFTQADLGLITDFEEKPNHELIVVGQNGAVFIKDGNSLNKSISFDKNSGRHNRTGCSSSVVGVELGVGSFLCRGDWGTNVELFDAAGKTLWSYGGGLSAIDNAAAGTLGPNAIPSVVVSDSTATAASVD